MDTKFEQEFEGAMDISYNEDRTIMSFHHDKTEYGGVVTRIAMYDDDNKPAPMHRATHYSRPPGGAGRELQHRPPAQCNHPLGRR